MVKKSVFHPVEKTLFEAFIVAGRLANFNTIIIG